MPLAAWRAMAALASWSDQRFFMPCFYSSAWMPASLAILTQVATSCKVGLERDRIAQVDREAELVDPLHHVGPPEAGDDLLRQAVEDRLRRAGRRKESGPRRGI